MWLPTDSVGVCFQTVLFVVYLKYNTGCLKLKFCDNCCSIGSLDGGSGAEALG